MTTALAIFGYNRPEHLRKCLEAVKRNKQIDTFIFLDGGYDYEVFDVAESFYKGCVFPRRDLPTLGISKAICGGIDILLKRFDSIIVVEDDIIVSDNFIEYMLKGLEYYKDKKDIGSLTGYAMVENPTVYSAKRFTGWGWATWKDRWDKFERNIEPLDSWGDDFPVMLDNALKYKIDTWDAQFGAYHFMNNLKCICPPKSLTKNIGSYGTHTKGLSKFNTEINNVEPIFKYPVEIDEGIRKEFCKIHDLSLIRKCINFAKGLWKG